MTKVIHGGKRADEITEEDLTHPGKPCHRNTKHGPAVAEEYAMEKMARYLLIDPKTGKLCPDNEAILCREVVTDGDTKGSTRLINVQAEIVPEFAGVAEYFPDIGHFVKCISGAFHKLAGSCAELRGVSLLESARIKTMVADISRILRQYGLQYKSIGSTLEAKTKLDECRERTIKKIASIIPHHCGDHATCCYEDCKMIQLRRHFIARYRTEFQDKDEDEVSNKEILRLHKQDIAREYARVSRFKGKVMSMGKVGQQRVYKEITTRLNASNIDRVALVLSSNDCENFFGMLAKYSHGKRIYFGQTDSWKVYQLLVAGLRSDDNFEDKILAHAGIASSYVRDVSTAKLVKKKQYHRDRKKTEKYKRRRKLGQYAKVRNAVKNSTAAARHRPNKQSPVNSCKNKRPLANQPQKKVTRKRKAKCQNCKVVHTGSCEEPDYPGAKNRKNTKEQKQKDGKKARRADVYNVLYGGG